MTFALRPRRPDDAAPGASGGPAAVLARRGPAALVALGLLLSALAYVRVLDGELQFDDTFGVQANPAVKDLGGYLRDRFLPGFAAGGRPVVDVTFAANYHLGRLDPRNFHVTNVALHLATALLAFAFARRVARLAGAARGAWLAAVAAAVFAVHPLQSQAVSYVSQRAEVLASLLYLATVLSLLEAGRRRGLAAAAALAGATLAFALALGTKIVVLTAPVAYLLVGWASAPAARAEVGPARRRVALAAPLLVLGALSAAATLRSVEGHTDAGFDVPGLGPFTYLLTELRVVVVYLRLLAFPAGQNVDWDFPASRSLAEPAVLASGALLVLLAAASVWLVVRSRGRDGEGPGAARLAGLGVLWFFLLLSVTSSLVPLVDVLVEHRVYLASLGLFLAAAAGVERLVARGAASRARLAVAAAVLAVVVLAAALHRRNAVWETRAALWSDALAKSPGKARPYLSLGWALRNEGRYDEAMALYRAGLARAAPGSEDGLKLTVNLGTALLYAGRADEAIAVFRRGLEFAPRRPDLVLDMGIALGQKGDDAGAEAWLRDAAALDPAQPFVWNALAALRLRRRDYAGALPLAERARALDPDFGEAQLNAGQALLGVGRVAEACEAWRQAILLDLRGGGREAAERLVRERCR